MRLRNIPRAESVLEACKEVVKNPESLCGHWNQEFQKEQPLHIEIGMGKGQFLLTLAAENPQINLTYVRQCHRCCHNHHFHSSALYSKFQF